MLLKRYKTISRVSLHFISLARSCKKTHSGWKLGEILYYEFLPGSSSSLNVDAVIPAGVCVKQHSPSNTRVIVGNKGFIYCTWHFSHLWSTHLDYMNILRTSSRASAWLKSLLPHFRWDKNSIPCKVTTSLISTTSNLALKQWPNEVFQTKLFLKY